MYASVKHMLCRQIILFTDQLTAIKQVAESFIDQHSVTRTSEHFLYIQIDIIQLDLRLL